MAKEQLRAITEILNVAKQLRGELDKTEKKIVSISSAARKAKESFQFTGPKKVNEELAQNKTLIDKLNTSLKKQTDANKKLQEQLKKLATVKKTNNKLTIQERENKRLLTQQLKLQHRASDLLATSYSRQSAKLILLRNRYKDLAVKQQMGIKLSVAERKEKERLIQQINKLDGALKKVDRTVGQSQRNVGNYRGALSRLGGTLRNLAGAFGLVGGVMIFAQLMRNGIRTIIDFGKANATLSGVLRLQKDEMGALIEDSKRLGAITVKTANEVVGLQIAYARLGFSQEQIIALTESTIEGSIAMNSELSETAELTGAVVNSMAEFSAIDAPEIMDILALSTAKSALTFEKLTTSLPKVLGAANALNIPFTKVVATLGKLSDAGIEASISGTSLRKIFISAAKRGIDYEKALDKVRESTDKVKTANEIFGTRAAISALLIAENTDAVNELDIALQKARGTTKEMADKELDTLSGSLKLLVSAWQGVILKENEANGIGEKLKRGLKSLAQNLDKVIDFLKRSIKAWLIYKGTLIAISVGTRAYIGMVTALRLAKIALAGGIGKATKAMRLFNIASKSNPIGAMIGLLTTVVALFIAFGDGANAAARSQRNLNKAIEEGKELAQDRKELSDKRIQDEIDNIRERTRAQVAETKDEKKIFDIRKKAIAETVTLLKNEREAVRKTTIAYANQLKNFDKGSPKWAKLSVGMKESAKLYDELTIKINSLTTDQNELNKELEDESGIRGKLVSVIGFLKTAHDELKSKITKAWHDGLISLETYHRALNRLKTATAEGIGIDDALGTDEAVLDVSLDLDFVIETDKDIIEELNKSLDETAEKLEKIGKVGSGAWEENLLAAVQFFGEATQLASALFDRRIQDIDDEILRSDEKYVKLLADENLSLEQRAFIEAEAERSRVELEKKKRAEQRKQAIIQKAFRATEIIANTAVAVSKTLAEGGYILGVPLSAFVAALGAVQLATVLAQPIPNFKEGHLSGQHEGLALINDAKGFNYKEIVERKSGRMEMFSGRNTLIDMDKGDRVHKAGTFSPKDAIARSAMALSIENQKGLMTEAQAGNSFDINISNEISKQIAKGYRGLKPYRPENFNYKKFANEMYILNRANKI